MFKPSLRKSILNENLCLVPQAKADIFSPVVQEKRTPTVRFIEPSKISQNINIPSMMVSQQILHRTQFTTNMQYSHVFTPLSYDFKGYPAVIKNIIQQNPNAARAGRIGQINYIIFKQWFFLWHSPSNSKPSLLEICRFKQKISLAEFSIMRNENIFKKEEVLILVIVFGNRLRLFRVSEKQLKIQDLMMNYKLRSCGNIQQIHFTKQNEIVFAGDSGQVSMLSFNSKKLMAVNVKSSILKKYFSKSAFDYSTKYFVRQIAVEQDFLYCLQDKISKSNYLMYLLKKAVNCIVRLQEQPKYIIEETFIDVYRFSNQDRKEIVFVDKLRQDQITKKIVEGYSNFNGEGVQDGFKIVSIQTVSQTKKIIPVEIQKPFIQNSHTQVMKSPTIQKRMPILSVITKCGYMFDLIHETLEKQKDSNAETKQNFSFLCHPIKLVENVGQAYLFEPKVFLPLIVQKQSRKNFVIKVMPLSKKQRIILMNNCLIFQGDRQIGKIKFNDLKLGIYETTKYQELFLPTEEYFDRFERKIAKKSEQLEDANLFEMKKQAYPDTGSQYIKLFTNQRRWTVFDNDGQFDIHHLELKHILLAYIYFQCEFSNHNQAVKSFDSTNTTLIESDFRLHSTIEKMIKVYGYCNFMKAVTEILINNSNSQREYFYFQKELFFEVVRRQFDYELPAKFQDWLYSLNQYQAAERIVPTERMLRFIWITLFEHQNKHALPSQVLSQSVIDSQFSRKVNEYSQAKTNFTYTAYGYALKSIFNRITQILVNFHARQFKLKERSLKQCQQKLFLLSNFIQSKKAKFETQQYRNYLQMKMMNLSKKKVSSPYSKNLNTTVSTNNSSASMTNEESLEEQRENGFIVKEKTYQSNEGLERSIYSAIRKIISLIDVMHILIEKDEREGLPSFIQILTNFQNQLLVGEVFYKEELIVTENSVDFVHPELVKSVQQSLPELNLDKKIDFLKFKIARNIAFGTSLNDIDLKSLNFDRLSQLISSNEIPELRQIFMGQKPELLFQKIYFYSEFLSICLAKNIKKVRNLSSIKQQKFSNLSQEMKQGKGKFQSSSLASHITVQKIVLIEQQLAYFQAQMSKFYQQIKRVFEKSVQQLKTLSGPQYFESEKYLEKIINLLISSFGSQQVLVQSLEIALKEAGLFDKVHLIKKIRQQKFFTRDPTQIKITVAKEKQFKFEQRSTFEYLIDKAKKNLSDEATFDTLRTQQL